MPLPRALSFFSLSSPSATSDQQTDGCQKLSSPRASSATPSTSQTATASDPGSTHRNRKKRAQKKAAKARRRTIGQPFEDGASEPDEDRDADEDELPLSRTSVNDAGDDAPEADEDDSYLYEHKHPPSSAASALEATTDERPPAFEVPATPEEAREAVAEAARRRRALEKEKKAHIKVTPTTRLQLPPGAGMVEGVPAIRSTPERRKKLEEAGFVPLTDEDGMLRMGVRVSEDTVIVPRPGAEEPVVLRM
ncbi:hypothetical protein JCM6882_003060 [Rhodosporidiobolus microsporus]